MSISDVSERREIPPLVRFERRAVENKRLSLEAGRTISDDVDFVMVTPPYSKDVYENKVETWLESQRRNVTMGRLNRRQYEGYEAAYEAWKKGEEIPVDGTPIKTWSALSPAQAQNVISAGIVTIEMLAGCNDEGLRRLGMGGRDLVKLAQNWLASADSNGKMAMKVTELEKQVERLELDKKGLTETVNSLKSQLETVQGYQSQPAEPAYEAPKIDINAMFDDGDDATTLPGVPVQEPTRPNVTVDIEPTSQEPAEDVTVNVVTQQETPDFDHMHLDDLKAHYKARFGRNPHSRMALSKLIKKLKE